jgi:hypothetical protein
MTYDRFLEYLEMGWVKQVDLYDNSRNAIQASSPEQIAHNLFVLKSQWVLHNLFKIKEYNIDFTCSSSSEKVFCNNC